MENDWSCWTAMNKMRVEVDPLDYPKFHLCKEASPGSEFFKRLETHQFTCIISGHRTQELFADLGLLVLVVNELDDSTTAKRIGFLEVSSFFNYLDGAEKRRYTSLQDVPTRLRRIRIG